MQYNKLMSIVFIGLFTLSGCGYVPDSQRRLDAGLPEEGELKCEDVFLSMDDFESTFFDPLKNDYQFEQLQNDLYDLRLENKFQREDIQYKLDNEDLTDAQRAELDLQMEELLAEDSEMVHESVVLMDKLVSAHVCYGLSAIRINEGCEEMLVKDKNIDRDFASQICSDCYGKERVRQCDNKQDVTLRDLFDWSYLSTPNQTDNFRPGSDDIYDIFLKDPFLWQLDEALDILGDPCVPLAPYQERLGELQRQLELLADDINELEALLVAQSDIVQRDPSRESRARMNELNDTLENKRDEFIFVMDEGAAIQNKIDYESLKGYAKFVGKNCGSTDDFIVPLVDEPIFPAEPLPPRETDIEFTPLTPDPVLDVQPDMSVEEIWADTLCGGSVQIVGKLVGDVSNISEVRVGVRVGSTGALSQSHAGFDPSSGAFTATIRLNPGTYEYHIEVTPMLGRSFGQRLGTFTIESCRDNTSPAVGDADVDENPRDASTEPYANLEDNVENIDSITTTPLDNSTSIGCPNADTCTSYIEYGFPVCDVTNLPSNCRPGDSSPGWDCYTWNEPSCNPTMRCFCIAPPESF